MYLLHLFYFKQLDHRANEVFFELMLHIGNVTSVIK